MLTHFVEFFAWQRLLFECHALLIHPKCIIQKNEKEEQQLQCACVRVSVCLRNWEIRAHVEYQRAFSFMDGFQEPISRQQHLDKTYQMEFKS